MLPDDHRPHSECNWTGLHVGEGIGADPRSENLIGHHSCTPWRRSDSCPLVVGFRDKPYATAVDGEQ